jgi:transposase-like protein
MARNPVQFQRGMSLATFLQRYGSEEQCHDALIAMRWRSGFVCPSCGGRSHSYCRPRRLFQCSACGHQASVKAGTIFHHTKVSLTKWFLAIYLLAQSKNDIAAMELMRQLGVKYDTAWLMKQKIMAAMLETNATEKLNGDVQVDDAYLGGVRSGKGGRGSPNKVPFVAAVETRRDRPRRAQLRRLASFKENQIEQWAVVSVGRNANVVTDGFLPFEVFAKKGYRHDIVLTGSGRPRERAFHWVNTLLGNLKMAMTGTFHAVRRQHAHRYLAAFEWRFNHRFDLAGAIEDLAETLIGAKPAPYRSITPAEASG